MDPCVTVNGFCEALLLLLFQESGVVMTASACGCPIPFELFGIAILQAQQCRGLRRHARARPRRRGIAAASAGHVVRC